MKNDRVTVLGAGLRGARPRFSLLNAASLYRLWKCALSGVPPHIKRICMGNSCAQIRFGPTACKTGQGF